MAKNSVRTRSLTATGDCTTANDVVILQTVPIPKVTWLWRHDQNKTKHSSGLEEAICAMVTWTIDQFYGYEVTIERVVGDHWSSDITDVFIKAV